VADPGFYRETAETIRQTLAQLGGLQQGLLDADKPLTRQSLPADHPRCALVICLMLYRLY
jgi:hypothetical protein